MLVLINKIVIFVDSDYEDPNSIEKKILAQQDTVIVKNYVGYILFFLSLIHI